MCIRDRGSAAGAPQAARPSTSAAQSRMESSFFIFIISFKFKLSESAVFQSHGGLAEGLYELNDDHDYGAHGEHDGVVTVSYTHLDVYKRQDYYLPLEPGDEVSVVEETSRGYLCLLYTSPARPQRRSGRAARARRGAHRLSPARHSPGAVSDTHLDVYKRQPLDAGPYITLGMCYATHPYTGRSDVTIHRLCICLLYTSRWV